MIKRSPVLRICISCRKTYDRENLLRITKDHKLGIILHTGMGRSAYICKSPKCYGDVKIKKKLQRSLKITLDSSFFDIFEQEIANYK